MLGNVFYYSGPLRSHGDGINDGGHSGDVRRSHLMAINSIISLISCYSNYIKFT